MKKLSLVLTFLLVFSLTSFAQEKSNIGFGGGRYDSDEGFIVNVGYGRQISGPLWTLGYFDLGLDRDIGAEVGVFTSLKFIQDTKLFRNLGIGLLAGPGVDWIGDGNGEEVDFTSYFRGAGGGIFYYNITQIFGISVFGKYKFSFDNQNQYVSGWIAGANAFLRF